VGVSPAIRQLLLGKQGHASVLTESQVHAAWGHAKNLSTPSDQNIFVSHSFQTKYSFGNLAYYFLQKRTLNLTSKFRSAHDTPTAQSGKWRNDNNPLNTTPPSKFAVSTKSLHVFGPSNSDRISPRRKFSPVQSSNELERRSSKKPVLPCMPPNHQDFMEIQTPLAR
jgi:hypothetical protein